MNANELTLKAMVVAWLATSPSPPNMKIKTVNPMTSSSIWSPLGQPK